MKSYPIFRKENLPAYMVVMSSWCLFSLLSAMGLSLFLAPGLGFGPALIWAAITVMLGMGIMFGASALNLRKLGPGFKRLARGETDPNIPPVWCPVLTAATNAALELSENIRSNKINSHKG